ncbi:hypothetical protein POM88_026239 [Heracleum sosnowskyi]|uniref:DNA-directed RNA polymerase n=1 Tax=Heracleum sosnowskyi TaxID=360622 RepID=A0AAD8I8Q4_9APIA|nr:hypothetical protein POM88_026239 [Heracleum sosnowskyi]
MYLAPCSVCCSVGIDKQFLAAPVKSAVDKFQLLLEFLKVRGLVKQHLDSFNYFVRTGMKNIMRANKEIRSTVDKNVYLRYKSVRIALRCRLSDITYAAPIYVDIEYVIESTGKKSIATKSDVIIGKMPIMLRSCCCECPQDRGGYFIVKGTEKVILIQEQLSNNRIIIDTDKKGCVQTSVMSSTEARKSKTVIVTEKQKIYLSLNQFEKKVPIMVVMKAMGMESDQEVVQMLGRDRRCGALLFPSIEECASHHVHTKQVALEFLEGKVAKSRFYSASVEKEGRAMVILRDVFVANIPDYVGNKRLELSEQLLSLLFEDLVKTLNEEAVKEVDAFLNKPSRSRFDFSTSNIGQTYMSVLVVARLSFIGTLGMMTRIQPQFEKSRKVSGPRALQPSQWGMLCPCDTPEGEACGLVKNLALMTHVTTDQEEGPIISLCYCLGDEDLELLSAEELHAPNSYLIILNGLILGKHRRPKKFAQAMRKLGRAGKIVYIFVNEKQVNIIVSESSTELAVKLYRSEHDCLHQFFSIYFEYIYELVTSSENLHF